MVSDAEIDAALARRNLSPVLVPRIRRLLEGQEDRDRLRCCNSGCFVCVKDVRTILAELESAPESA
jgi:hypothetical protein